MPCCPASSATADYAAAVFHSVFARLRHRLAEAKSKMPFNKCSAAMSFQVGFKGVGFFSVFKSNGVFDPPWSEFRCMRHIAFVVFFQTGF